MVKLLVDGQERKFTTTIFPDGTSQVWKLDLGLEEGDKIEILWLFENEAELFHVCQLSNLLNVDYDYAPTLIVPYLPYGRQDKDVSNGKTFALNTFKDLLFASGIQMIETFDAHSESELVDSISPKEFHESIVDHDIICFPDAGAANRYKYNFNIDIYTQVCFEKVRNQQTGEITGLKLLGSNEIEGRSVLIVDDICDGGMTFIKVAEALKQYKPSKIDLAVSHGLFSKGKQCLFDAGISNIYTTNSLLKNPEGYKVW